MTLLIMSREENAKHFTGTKNVAEQNTAEGEARTVFYGTRAAKSHRNANRVLRSLKGAHFISLFNYFFPLS